MRNIRINRCLYFIVKTLFKNWFDAMFGLNMGNLKFYDIKLTFSMVLVHSVFYVIL